MTSIQFLTEQFRAAQRNIGLGTRRRVAIAAHLEVRAVLNGARPLIERGLADVLIGSYPRETGIWPGKDVDVFAKLTNESIDSIAPSEAHDLFLSVLERSFPGRIQPQDRSVKVEYRPSTLPALAWRCCVVRTGGVAEPDRRGSSDAGCELVERGCDA